MQKIESQLDLEVWSHAVNYAGTASQIMPLCDLQDVFARSDVKAVKRLFIDANQHEKEAIIFSVQKAMGSAALFDFIKSYANHKAQAVIDADSEDMADRWTAVLKKEYELAKREKAIQPSLQLLADNVKHLECRELELTESRKIQLGRIREMENELDRVYAELKRLEAFEAHIKSLLN